MSSPTLFVAQDIPPPTTSLDAVRASQESILLRFPNPDHQVMAILFADGHNIPEVVPVPCQNGIISLEYWVNPPHISNYIIHRTQMAHIGVHRAVITALAAPCQSYSVFYMSQSVAMPVNQALLRFSAGAADHTLLRGNVLIVKHPGRQRNIYTHLTEENIEECGNLIGSLVADGDTRSIVDDDRRGVCDTPGFSSVASRILA
ncbi:hypothetical protein JVT61DRAFT_14859 [Boletus reticuloceps]|uniref:Uncharacterized protein n=1 Tax=Boletus reticuloceps TaxID=495285 RepID=A0A8I3A2V6_9AGAM|nr:hypothetical protein JVT61DRAFT_14859 [Boletus reticuloceps]